MAAAGMQADPYRILETKLNELSSRYSSSHSFIFRAPNHLRQVNIGAFEPQVISMGPYYHHHDKYKAMEIYKLRYLKGLLERQHASQGFSIRDVLDSFVVSSRTMEENVRNCYADQTVNNMSSAEFVAMVVLDGLFVVELLRKFKNDRLIEENDDLFKQNLNLSIIAQDLLLLENQLPFFVLNHFFEKTKLPGEAYLEIMAISFLSNKVPGLGKPDLELKYHVFDRVKSLDHKHLLGLVHYFFLPRPEFNVTEMLLGLKSSIPLTPHFQTTLNELLRLIRFKKQGENRVLGFSIIRSATELLDVGIRFKKWRGNSLFEIKFEKGKMHIPTLTVDHDTERIFRNLIAYEHFKQGPCIVTDYARLMDCLINYAEDVALLSDCGIIDNRLGTKEEVADMFNNLNDYVHLSTVNFYYSELFLDVNQHCNRRLNLWKVKLRQKYFNTPWDWVLTSIVAASILLLLSLVQTIYSVMS